MAECHDIQLSKAAEKEQAKAQGGAQAAAGVGVTDSVTERRKREAIRRLLSAPAKPTTPYSDAEMAVIASKRDKKAEDELLIRTQAAARRNCHIYCEKRDLG